MAASSATQDSNGPHGLDRKASVQGIDRAVALCAQALEICDSLDVSPEIGARLQGVISALEDVPKA